MTGTSKAAVTSARATAIVMAAALLCGQLAGATHALRVAHAVCEHGQLVHAETGPERRAEAPAVSSVPAAGDVHEHGCAVLFHSRAPARSPGPAAAAGEPPHEGSPVAPPAPFHAPRSATLRVAPSRSPPA